MRGVFSPTVPVLLLTSTVGRCLSLSLHRSDPPRHTALDDSVSSLWSSSIICLDEGRKRLFIFRFTNNNEIHFTFDPQLSARCFSFHPILYLRTELHRIDELQILLKWSFYLQLKWDQKVTNIQNTNSLLLYGQPCFNVTFLRLLNHKLSKILEFL